MKNVKTKVFITFLLATGVIILQSCCGDCEHNQFSLELELALKKDSLEYFMQQYDSLLSVHLQLKEETNDWTKDVSLRFKEIGIESKHEVSEILYYTPEIIPFPGILGGSMKIRDIRFISDKWILAGCCDGHYVGYLILDYTINKDSTINWKVLDYIKD